MTDSNNNVDQLHDAGAINKADLTDEHKKALNTLSQEEVEQLKAINKKMKKGSGDDVTVGISL